jgi:5-methylcytosine-specific restriction endonuclease McrA
MKSLNIRKEIVKALVDLGWSELDAQIADRANYRCEYCGLDFLESPDNYRMWQKDHIIPLHKEEDNDLSNYAACCRNCNMLYKSRWDPRKVAGNSADRESLVEAVRMHVKDAKAKVLKELNEVRAIRGIRR